MTQREASKLTVRSPADLLGAVPYLIGFHPADSAVVLALRAATVVFSVRVDLLPVGASTGEISRLSGHVADVVHRQQPTAALLVGYGEQDRVDPLLSAIGDALSERGVGVQEALRACDGRYWSYLCGVTDCCPPEGTPYDPVATPIAAAATYAGCVALPDRAALERTLDPVGPTAAEAVSRALQDVGTELAGLTGRGAGSLVAAGRAGVRSAVTRYRTGGRLTDEELARLVVLLSSLAVRDYGWERIVRDAPALDHHVALWTDVVRRTPADLLAAPACLLGVAAWRTGNGALAMVAFDRALAVEPTCSMAQLMIEGLRHGMAPEALDSVFPPFRRRRSAADPAAGQPAQPGGQ